MIAILAINQEIGLVHHHLGQFMIMHVFQNSVNKLIMQMAI